VVEEGRDNRVSFEKVEKRNEKLERFYNDVLGLSDEEKSEFWAALKRELPKQLPLRRIQKGMWDFLLHSRRF